MQKKRPLKIGFDLDGVILYNPARNIRPILAYFRKKVVRKEKKEFYIPQTAIEKIFWFLVHKSSIAPAQGLDDLKRFVKNKKVEAYLITARYDSLKHDFDRWMRLIEADKLFAKFVHNRKNEQPHEFKKRMIKQLNLDYFVEDNWDIIRLINRLDKKSKTKILWITNFLDSKIIYKYKFKNFRSVIDFLKKQIDK